MKEEKMIPQGIKKCLENTGILIDEYDNTLKLSEIILDSLALVTFEIELENYFDIEIPAEKFSRDWLSMSLSKLELIIKSCL